MIRRRVLLVGIMILTIISIVGCNRYKDLGDEYIPGKDAQYMFIQSYEGKYIAKSEDGYYFANGNYLYYADSEAMKPVILCNKPNCLHDKELDSYKKADCNAFVGYEAGSKLLTIYDDYIYYYGINEKDKMKPYIFRLSLDGTEKKAICKIDGDINSMALHRGKLYYSISQSTVKHGEEDEGQNIAKFMEYDFLDSSAEPKVLKEFKNIGGGIQDIVPYGKNIYFTEYGFGKDPDEFKSIVSIYNLKNKSFSKLANDLKIKGISFNTFFKGKNIYTPVVESGNEYKIDPHIYACDLDGNNIKLLFEDEIQEMYYADNNYIYLDNEKMIDKNNENIKRELKVLNEKGELIETIDINEIGTNFRFTGSDDKYLFIKYEDEEKAYIKYIDIKEIGTGKAKLKDFFEIDIKYMDSGVYYKK